MWIELQKQLEGGAKTLKNNTALCINEYFAFKALENEALKETYTRFNSLVNKCKRFGVERTTENNNLRFLQSLNDEWVSFSISLQTTLDLENWSLPDLYGLHISQEAYSSKLKTQMGGPLELVGRSSEGWNIQKDEVEQNKKKKAFVAESDEEESSEEEMDMKSMMNTLSLITKEYNIGFRRPSYKSKYEKE